MNGIIVYLRSLIRKRSIPKSGEGFQWIDGEGSDKPTEESGPLPMFYEGDIVQLFNPYEGGFMITGMFSIEPERYRIVDVDYDGEQKVFRYKLEDVSGGEDEFGGGLAEIGEEFYDDYISEDLWYSEEWLSLPTVTNFASRRESESEGDALTDLTVRIDMEEQKERLEDAMTVKSVENELKEREIDRMLDLYRNGDAEERKAAEKELRKLTGGVAE